jgi:hypothetical protein
LPHRIADSLSSIELEQQKEANDMNPETTSGLEAQATPQSAPLDRQFAELIEQVWSCERQWALDDRIDAAIKYGRA